MQIDKPSQAQTNTIRAEQAASRPSGRCSCNGLATLTMDEEEPKDSTQDPEEGGQEGEGLGGAQAAAKARQADPIPVEGVPGAFRTLYPLIFPLDKQAEGCKPGEG